jgi:hypothetical protein
MTAREAVGPLGYARARCGHCSACASNQMLRRTFPTAERTVTPSGKQKKSKWLLTRETRLENAPLLARENFRIVSARSRMLPSVRPVMQRWSAAGLYGSSRARSKSPKACLKHCGKPWFSQPRLADCCAILSFRSPYALTVARALRRYGRSSINAAFDQESPDHARHFVGQGHSDQHLRLAWQHLCQP